MFPPSLNEHFSQASVHSLTLKSRVTYRSPSRYSLEVLYVLWKHFLFLFVSHTEPFKAPRLKLSSPLKSYQTPSSSQKKLENEQMDKEGDVLMKETDVSPTAQRPRALRRKRTSMAPSQEPSQVVSHSPLFVFRRQQTEKEETSNISIPHKHRSKQKPLVLIECPNPLPMSIFPIRNDNRNNDQLKPCYTNQVSVPLLINPFDKKDHS